MAQTVIRTQPINLTGLPGADAIRFVSAISLHGVNEIITLDGHFKRVKDQIKVTILNE